MGLSGPLIDLSAEFHGLAGERYVLTIITDAEKPPQVMGFGLLDEGVQPLLQQEANVDMQPAAPLAPEDEEIVVTLIHKEQM